MIKLWSSLLGRFFKECFSLEKEYKCIFKPFVARKLLKEGNPIADIKPDRNNPIRTIFVFEKTEKLDKDLTTLGE